MWPIYHSQTEHGYNSPVPGQKWCKSNISFQETKNSESPHKAGYRFYK